MCGGSCLSLTSMLSPGIELRVPGLRDRCLNQRSYLNGPDVKYFMGSMIIIIMECLYLQLVILNWNCCTAEGSPWEHSSTLNTGKGTGSWSSIPNSGVLGSCQFSEKLQFLTHHSLVPFLPQFCAVDRESLWFVGGDNWYLRHFNLLRFYSRG